MISAISWYNQRVSKNTLPLVITGVIAMVLILGTPIVLASETDASSTDKSSETLVVDPTPLTINASIVVCNNETDLPNASYKGWSIDANTAASYVSSHSSACHLESGWDFQWGYADVTDPGGSIVGPAAGAWTKFGSTDAAGQTATTISNLNNTSKIWVREALKDGYLTFAEPPIAGTSPKDEVSAELTCATDAKNYDNYEQIIGPVLGKTYYCVGWNVLKPVTPPPTTNHPPMITLLGSNPLSLTIGDSFIDPGATATDTEDGDISAKIATTSTVVTTATGTYAVTYSVTDTGGLSTSTTRIVNVNDAPTTPPVVPPVNPPTIPPQGGGGGYSIMGGGYSRPYIAPSSTTTDTCPLLRDFLRYGIANDPSEVAKLQSFLRSTEGLDVDVNGTFDDKTLAGVNAFQTKYLSEVMGAWGASQPSGYVYITTKKKINQIACDLAFVINPDEQAIIDAYKSAVSSQGTNIPTGFQSTSPSDLPAGLEPSVPTSTVPLIGEGTTTSGSSNVAAVGSQNTSGKVWGFIKGMFGF